MNLYRTLHLFLYVCWNFIEDGHGAEVFRDCTRELYDRVVRFEYLYYKLQQFDMRLQGMDCPSRARRPTPQLSSHQNKQPATFLLIFNLIFNGGFPGIKF